MPAFLEHELKEFVAQESDIKGKVPVAEIFPAFQGEGMLVGQPTLFLRLGGCNDRCSWVIEENELILLANLTTKPAKNIKTGDQIVGLKRELKKNGIKNGQQNWMERTSGPYKIGEVEDVQFDIQQLYKVHFLDGRKVTVGPEHYFIDVLGRMQLVTKLKKGTKLRAFQTWDKQTRNTSWKRGYLAGAVDGDGCFTTQGRFQIASGSKPEMLAMIKEILSSYEIKFTERMHISGGDFAEAKKIPCIGVSKNMHVQRLKELVEEDLGSSSYWRGYFAGIYDTDGSTDGKNIRISQKKKRQRERIETCLRFLGISYSDQNNMYTIQGGLSTKRRLLLETLPTVERKKKLVLQNGHGIRDGAIVSRVEKCDRGNVVAIQTTLGTYMGGNGILHRNCDSKYAVLPKYSKLWVRMSPTDVVRGLQAANERIRHITLTGGNPAIHKSFAAHLSYLQDTFGYTVAIETQGNIYPEWAKDLDQVTLSPKGPSSGNVTDVDSEEFHSWVDERELSILKLIDEKDPLRFQMTDEVAYDNLCIKIVIFNEEDYTYAKEVHRKFPNVPLYLQPGTEQGVDDPTEQIIRGTLWLESWIALDRAFDLAKVRIIPQMHVLLHGVKRGV